MADEWSAALPDDPLCRRAVGSQPRSRVGWSVGSILVGALDLEPPDAVTVDEALVDVARRMQVNGAGMVPVVDGARHLVGALYIDDLLACFGEGGAVRDRISLLVPTCRRDTTAVDALREMLSCHLRRLPIIDETGKLLGQLTLAACAAAADRDPYVRDVLAAAAVTPSLWAIRWR